VIDRVIFLKAIKSLKYTACSCSSNSCTGHNFCIKELIRGKRQITVSDIASISGISVGSVETIIHEHPFETLGAWWVPKVLMSDQKAQNVAMSAGHLHQFEMGENIFLELIKM
jgi:hypothetical protein